MVTQHARIREVNSALSPRPNPIQNPPKLQLILGITLVYLAIASIVQFCFPQPIPIPLWPPAGLALIAGYQYRSSAWIAVGCGEFLLRLVLQNRGLPLSLLLSVGAVAQAWVGVRILHQHPYDVWLHRPKAAFRSLLVLIFASTLINATLRFGAWSYSPASVLGDKVYGSQVWTTFWFGDALGILCILAIALALPEAKAVLQKRGQELAGGCLLLWLVGFSIFGAPAQAAIHALHPEFWMMPFLVVAALRLGLVGATVASTSLCAIAIWGIRVQRGPFIAFSSQVDTAVIAAQIFMLIATLMTLGIATADTQLQKSERQRILLSRYFAPQLVDKLADLDTPLSDRRQSIALLYVDITGFSTLISNFSPDAIMSLLRAFYALMEACIFKHEGVVERYTGDGIVAVFGVPERTSQDATQALACAHAMIENLAIYNAQQGLLGVPPIVIGIGIDYGSVVMGNVGTDRNLNFMMAGKSTKTAIRLKELCTQYQADICMSQLFREAVRRENPANPLLEGFTALGPKRLLGFKDSIRIWVLQSQMTNTYYDAASTAAAVDADEPDQEP